MRVSPSGKAVASQATIRGFESHHPLEQTAHPDWWAVRPNISFLYIAGFHQAVTHMLYNLLFQKLEFDGSILQYG